jgi:pellino protein
MYTLSRNHTVVVQYERDEKTDMFQIGRSSEPSIDFIVLDTHVTSPSTSPESSLQAPNQNNQLNNPQSTISRFSCRILVDREYPYTARIYAAGFDSSKSIFLGVYYLLFFNYLYINIFILKIH